MFYDGGFHMGGMHGFWWIFWVLVIGVLLLYVWGRPGDSRHRSRESPHEVPKRRLASGEVTPEEYDKRKALLDRDSGANT